MILLRLMDAREGEVLAHSHRRFRSLETAFQGLKRERAWKRGGLRMDDRLDSGPHFHVWAEAYDATGVKARWIWMEIRTIESIVGPDGKALPGTDQVTARRMEWICVDEEAARSFLKQPAAEGSEAQP